MLENFVCREKNELLGGGGFKLYPLKIQSEFRNTLVLGYIKMCMNESMNTGHVIISSGQN